ncbi:MAG: hypothetical protein KJ754_08460, partial [Bacteroidetes bacterium]|nr:hypothetical protein [Bacteroidota bacterium]MBU1579446.1 hypothetical protein [Bacteroidota bacterium]
MLRLNRHSSIDTTLGKIKISSIKSSSAERTGHPFLPDCASSVYLLKAYRFVSLPPDYKEGGFGPLPGQRTRKPAYAVGFLFFRIRIALRQAPFGRLRASQPRQIRTRGSRLTGGATSSKSGRDSKSHPDFA